MTFTLQAKFNRFLFMGEIETTLQGFNMSDGNGTSDDDGEGKEEEDTRGYCEYSLAELQILARRMSKLRRMRLVRAEGKGVFKASTGMGSDKGEAKESRFASPPSNVLQFLLLVSMGFKFWISVRREEIRSDWSF